VKLTRLQIMKKMETSLNDVVISVSMQAGFCNQDSSNYVSYA
jgi:hypothetical protein